MGPIGSKPGGKLLTNVFFDRLTSRMSRCSIRWVKASTRQFSTQSLITPVGKSSWFNYFSGSVCRCIWARSRGEFWLKQLFKCRTFNHIFAKLLSIIPQPTKAVILLFPLNFSIKENQTEFDKELTEEGQHSVDPTLVYVKQYVCS